MPEVLESDSAEEPAHTYFDYTGGTSAICQAWKALGRRDQGRNYHRYFENLCPLGERGSGSTEETSQARPASEASKNPEANYSDGPRYLSAAFVIIEPVPFLSSNWCFL
jgi:hypothetical protein